MLKVVVGHSNDPYSEDAIAEVLQQCQQELQETVPQAGILVAAIDFDHALILQQIQQSFPDLQLIGGTTHGEMSSVLGFQEDSLALMLFCSDRIKIRAGLGRAMSKNPLAAAQAAVEQAQVGLSNQAKFCITIPDGLSTSGVTIIDSLKQVLGESVPIMGGTAGDQWQFQQTYQFFQTEVLSDALPVLLFSGELCLSCGVASGWQPISRKARITKVEGARVYEIDHRPASEFYASYLKGLPMSGEYPLAVFGQEEREFYLRACTDQENRADGSLLFMGDIPVGALVQITHATTDDIIRGALISMEKAIACYPGQQPAAALLFSCAARRQLLGTLVPQEYETRQQYLALSIPTLGFYTYGEIGPLRPDGETLFHQETLVTVLIGES
jgi:hypothetical protein